MKKFNADLKNLAGSEKVGFIAGIALIVQSVAFALLGIALWGKKRSLAKTFAAAAAVGGAAGILLLACGKKKCCCLEEQNGEEEEDDLFGESFDEDDVFCNFENEGEDCCCGDCGEDEDAGGAEEENA